MANDSIALISKSYLDRNTVTSSTQLDSVTQVGKYVDATVLKDMNTKLEEVADGKLNIIEVVDPRTGQEFRSINSIYGYIRHIHSGNNLFDLDTDEPALLVANCQDGNRYFFISNKVPYQTDYKYPSYACLLDFNRKLPKEKNRPIYNVFVRKPVPIQPERIAGVPMGSIYYFQYGKPRFKIVLEGGDSFDFSINSEYGGIERNSIKIYPKRDAQYVSIRNVSSTGYTAENNGSDTVCITFTYNLPVGFMDGEGSICGVKVVSPGGQNPTHISEGSGGPYRSISSRSLVSPETTCRGITIRDHFELVYDESRSCRVNKQNINYFRRSELDVYCRHRRQIKKRFYVFGDGHREQTKYSDNVFRVDVFGDFLMIRRNKPFYFMGTITVQLKPDDSYFNGYVYNNTGGMVRTATVYIDDNELTYTIESADDEKNFYGWKVSNVTIDIDDWDGDYEPTVWSGHTTRRGHYRLVRHFGPGQGYCGPITGVAYYQYKFRGVKSLNKHQIVMQKENI